MKKDKTDVKRGFPYSKNRLIAQAICILTIAFFFFPMLSQPIEATSIEVWETTITISSDKISNTDTIIIGKATTATDGSPPDGFDTPKTIPPMVPYVRCWTDDTLSSPYHQLWKDYRNSYHLNISWNITIQWMPENYKDPAHISISWNRSELIQSGYDQISLYTKTGMKVADMLQETTYLFNATAMILYDFTIHAITSETTEQTPTSDSNPSYSSSTSKEQSAMEPFAHFSLNRNNTKTEEYEYIFDASSSFDPDGDIISYHWDFGDGTRGDGQIVIHTYQTPGEYSIICTVTDNDGYTNSYIDSLKITEADNQPPNLPLIEGPIKGSVNISYSYTITATDPDDDQLTCFIEWGDGYFSRNAKLSTHKNREIEHQWENPGIYQILLTISDDHSSRNTSLTVYIDAYPVPDNNIYHIYGYFIDTNSDNNYDIFYNTESGEHHRVSHRGSAYLLDVNSNGSWDVLFDIETNEFFDYEEAIGDPEAFPVFRSDLFIIIVMIAFVFIIIFLYVVKGQLKKSRNKS